jgi:drug/metabolite transporter (DMT)-like permease
MRRAAGDAPLAPATPPGERGGPLAVLPVLGAVTLWAFQGPALNAVGARWDPVTLGLWRYAVAALAFWALTALVARRTPGATVPPGLGRRLGLGGLLAGFGLLFTTAHVLGDPVLNVTLAPLMPITASLVTWGLTGARPEPRLIAALVLVVPGAMLAMPPVEAGGGAGAARSLLGLGLILAAQTCWSLYSLSVARWMPGAGQIERTRLSVIWSLPYQGAAFALALGLGLTAWDFGPALAADAALVAATALGPLVLGVTLWNAGVARLGLPVCALFMNAVPVIGAGAAALFGTVPTATQMTGAALVVAGMVWAQRRRR